MKQFIYTDVIFDTQSRLIMPHTRASQGDYMGSGLRVHVMNGSEVVDTSSFSLFLNFELPDGQKFNHASHEQDHPKGIFYIFYPTEMLGLGKSVKCQLKLRHDGKVSESNVFTVAIDRTLSGDGAEASNAFGELEKALQEARAYSDAVQGVINAEDLRVQAEDARVGAEAKRVEAETARAEIVDRLVAEVEAEKGAMTELIGQVEADEATRQSQEETRQSQEATRQSQEAERQAQEATRQSQEGVRESQEASRVQAETERNAIFEDLSSGVIPNATPSNAGTVIVRGAEGESAPYTVVTTGDGDARYAPTEHGHEASDISGLEDAMSSYALKTDLDSKADVSHTHSIGNVTGLQAALNTKADKTDLATKQSKIITATASPTDASLYQEGDVILVI